uniref:Salivary serine protease n=1 Tax=Simulium guianense TaxID=445764 RepID=F5GTQ8_SIMGU
MLFLPQTLLLVGLSLVLADHFTYKPAIDNEQFPWFCTVYSNEDFKPVCYCTILGKNAILTASRCFENRDIKNGDHPKYHVRFGSIAANGMRKLVNIEKIQGTQHLLMLKPKTPIEGYHAIELDDSKYVEPKNGNITVATFHSYGTKLSMKTHVHMVDMRLSKDTKNCQFAYPNKHFCAAESQNRCNIGLGTAAVSQSPKNSSRWILHGIVDQSPKCNGNSENADLFVKIDADRWNFIKHNLNLK